MKLIYKIIDWILLTIILIMLILTYLKIPPKKYFEREKTISEKLKESFKEEETLFDKLKELFKRGE
ncbi:hypothetical protein KA005_40985 [bacterium]|nr:hypothetical protein [bacterium]